MIICHAKASTELRHSQTTSTNIHHEMHVNIKDAAVIISPVICHAGVPQRRTAPTRHSTSKTISMIELEIVTSLASSHLIKAELLSSSLWARVINSLV